MLFLGSTDISCVTGLAGLARLLTPIVRSEGWAVASSDVPSIGLIPTLLAGRVADRSPATLVPIAGRLSYVGRRPGQLQTYQSPETGAIEMTRSARRELRPITDLKRTGIFSSEFVPRSLSNASALRVGFRADSAPAAWDPSRTSQSPLYDDKCFATALPPIHVPPKGTAGGAVFRGNVEGPQNQHEQEDRSVYQEVGGSQLGHTQPVPGCRGK